MHYKLIIIMKKSKKQDGTILINGVSFVEFNYSLMGFKVKDKKTKSIIPRFILFWSGKKIEEIKKEYNLVDY